ncbi:MAG: sigma-70 family RNA polymerase sigma factor [Actinomycetota bacterium]|nr:sigma-70 family RNA polymerase sigma factor [Actinomycetota bacterium]
MISSDPPPRPLAARTPLRFSSGIEAAFCAGDDGALKLAHDAHGCLVYGLCRRMLTAEQADEVTQDVFLSAWRARAQFDPSRGTLSAWLVGITKRRIVDHLRSEGRHANRRAEVGELPDRPGEAVVEQLADRLLVAAALRELPERARETLHLAYQQDLTHQQIAERTGRALGTVKSDIRRGLQAIRQHVRVSDG